MYWLLTITWKLRKGKPSEVIALTTGGILQLLLLHKHLANSMKVPESWIEFKLYKTAKEVRRLAPSLYRDLLERKRKEVK